MSNRGIEEYERLIKSAAMKYGKTLIKNHFDADDVVNEARIAAWKAVQHYDQNKKACIETYITSCVKHKMIDLMRSSKRFKHSFIKTVDNLVELSDRQMQVSQDVDHLIFMKQVLTTEELSYVDTVRFTSNTSLKSRRRIQKCLLLIQRKLMSSERNLKISKLNTQLKNRNEETA